MLSRRFFGSNRAVRTVGLSDHEGVVDRSDAAVSSAPAEVLRHPVDVGAAADRAAAAPVGLSFQPAPYQRLLDPLPVRLG